MGRRRKKRNRGGEKENRADPHPLSLSNLPQEATPYLWEIYTGLASLTKEIGYGHKQMPRDHSIRNRNRMPKSTDAKDLYLAIKEERDILRLAVKHQSFDLESTINERDEAIRMLYDE